MAAVMMLDILFRRRNRNNTTGKSRVVVKKPSTLPSTDSKMKHEPETKVKDGLKCRICLKKGNIPIFPKTYYDDIVDNIRIFGDIEVNEDDEFPQHMCEQCHNLMMSAVRFRKTAQKSNQKLRDPVSVLPPPTQRRKISPPQYGQKPSEKSSISVKTNTNIAIENATDNYSDDFGNDDRMDWNNDADDNDKPKETNGVIHCKKCSLDFTDPKEYSRHVRQGAHQRERVQCKVCHASVARCYISVHMLRVHCAVQPYMCDVCGKAFSVNGSFRRHLLTHTDLLPFKCAQCPYRGRFPESLKLHMRVHTGEKPYSCDKCPARFMTASNLKKHSRTHLGFDFKCEQCNRGFYSDIALQEHYRIDHTGLKEHVCNICGKEFGHRKQMMKHSRKVHHRPKMRNGRTPLYVQLERKLRQQEPDYEPSEDHIPGS